MANLADTLAELSTMSMAQLRAEWQSLLGELAPEAFGMEMLARGISYYLQEKAHGGLTGSARRQLDEAARQIAKAGAVSDRPAAMQAGTRLARDWHGPFKDAIDYLVEADWLRRAGTRSGDTPGRASADYLVNPAVHGGANG